MIELFLTRHGETVENRKRVLQGHLPGQLTVEGIRQAEQLRERLKGFPFDVVLSSDLKRCIDTAHIALRGREAVIETLPILREMDWGSITGKRIEEINFRQFPDDVETKEQLFERAAQFVDYLKAHYDGLRVLVFGHGMINRSIEANIRHVPIYEIRSVSKMNNAEVRRFFIYE